MIPEPWEFAALALAAFRLARLVGWDDFPPVARARAWLSGEVVTTTATLNARMGVSAEALTAVVSYRRPTLAHFLGCAYCQGAWIAGAVYGAWVAYPRATLYAAAPLALSAAVGIVARNLDP